MFSKRLPRLFVELYVCFSKTAISKSENPMKLKMINLKSAGVKFGYAIDNECVKFGKASLKVVVNVISLFLVSAKRG